MSMIEMTSPVPPEVPREVPHRPAAISPPLNREPAPDKSLDMVRNILFGEQVRELDRKQATLERFIRVSISSLAEDSQKKFDLLQHEINLLKDLLAEESKTRRDDVALARSRLDQHDRDLETYVKNAQSGHDEVHTRVGREVERLEQRLGDWRKELLDQLRVTAEQLRHEKADRKMVAAVLNGMARQLFDTSNEPDGTS